MRVFDGEAAAFVNWEGAEQTVAGTDQMLRGGVDGKIASGTGKHIPVGTKGCPLLRCDRDIVAAQKSIDQHFGKGRPEKPHGNAIQMQLHNGFQKASAYTGSV